jgi:5-methylcytosine-specific restriction endonuclease McrA
MSQGLTRSVLFGPVLPAALAGWLYEGEPGHLGGLGAMTVLSLLTVPVLLLTLATAPAAFVHLLVPRSWRVRYRKRHGREGARSAYIPKKLRRAVLAADRRRCVYCGAKDELQVDHGRPWARGGMATLFNCFALCKRDNRVKSDYWKDRDGTVHYHPWAGARDEKTAAAILKAERSARLNVFRWLRAAWAL